MGDWARKIDGEKHAQREREGERGMKQFWFEQDQARLGGRETSLVIRGLSRFMGVVGQRACKDLTRGEIRSMFCINPDNS